MNKAGSLVDFMCDPSHYPERPSSIRLVQTHISWVFIGDDFVYKIKKPVNFGFLDFSTLEKRKFYTEEELRLNRRFSGDIYLEVVPISAAGSDYIIGDASRVVEYALKMRRISEDHMLYGLVKRNAADEEMLTRVGEHLGRIYLSIPGDETAQRFGGLDTIAFNVRENFDQTMKYVGGVLTRDAFEDIRAWSLDFMDKRKDVFDTRCRLGWIKECHGDLHLQHICVDGDRIYVFDCIEFNERFRYGDVASDIAFLAMDLDFNGRQELSRAFVQGYERASRDGRLSEVLTFYKVYRAYVRAKVTSFMLDDSTLDEDLRKNAFHTASLYYELAHRYVRNED